MRRIWIGVMLTLGCVDPTAPAKALVMTASIDRPTFQLGDTITVTLTVVNRGERSRTLTTSVCPLLPFVLTNADGIEVGQGLVPGGCLLTLEATTLAPGGHVVFKVRWEGSVQKRVPNSCETLGPGTYLLHPRLVPESGVAIKQLPLTIHVLP